MNPKRKKRKILRVNNSHKQIPLDFKNRKNQTFQDFIAESNMLTLESMKNFTDSNAYIFYLWGEPGSGKTHLLNAYVESNNALNKPSVLIQPKDLSHRENVSLIEMFDSICIDDSELISGDLLLEEALFFWINEIKQTQKKLVLASSISNKDKQWQLADLRSRLTSGQTHQLIHLSRQGVIKAFVQQATEQGINIEDKAINYLENNCSMNMGFLKQLLIEIDKATLIHKKQATIPLIKNILQTVLVN